MPFALPTARSVSVVEGGWVWWNFCSRRVEEKVGREGWEPREEEIGKGKGWVGRGKEGGRVEARDTEGGREEAREKDESKEEEWEKERGEREKKYQCLFTIYTKAHETILLAV